MTQLDAIVVMRRCVRHLLIFAQVFHKLLHYQPNILDMFPVSFTNPVAVFESNKFLLWLFLNFAERILAFIFPEMRITWIIEECVSQSVIPVQLLAYYFVNLRLLKVEVALGIVLSHNLVVVKAHKLGSVEDHALNQLAFRIHLCLLALAFLGSLLFGVSLVE